MKRTTVWDLAFAVAFACASLLLCRVGWKIVAQRDSAADFWAAIGAIATAAAAMIALGIALRDGSRRRAEEDSKAAIAAARIAPMLTMLIGQLEAGRIRLTAYLDPAAPLQHFGAVLQTYDAMLWDLTLTDLLAIAPLPDRCAERIASGLAEVKLIQHMLRNAQSQFSDSGDAALRRATVIATTSLTASALNGLQPALIQCQKSSRVRFGIVIK